MRQTKKWRDICLHICMHFSTLHQNYTCFIMWKTEARLGWSQLNELFPASSVNNALVNRSSPLNLARISMARGGRCFPESAAQTSSSNLSPQACLLRWLWRFHSARTWTERFVLKIRRIPFAAVWLLLTLLAFNTLICSSFTVSLFFSRKPSHWYSTCPWEQSTFHAEKKRSLKVYILFMLMQICKANLLKLWKLPGFFKYDMQMFA